MSQQTANIQAEKANTYDAIVIGSGITGGWAAKGLTEKGLRTIYGLLSMPESLIDLHGHDCTRMRLRCEANATRRTVDDALFTRTAWHAFAGFLNRTIGSYM